MTAQPRLLYMAKPQWDVLSSMVKEITKLGLDTLLGSALFAPENWHQSLSIRYPSEPDYRERLLRAGSRIRATSFSMTLDHVVSQGEAAGRIHWAFQAHRKSKGLQVLLSTVQGALRTERLDAGSGHNPH